MRLAALLALALLPLLALACGGDDSGGVTVSTISPTKRPAATQIIGTPALTNKTPEKPAPTAEPSEAPTPTPGPPTERPTPAAVGTRPWRLPIRRPSWPNSRQARSERDLHLQPGQRHHQLPRRGLYAIDPPITGQDITCSLLIIEGMPRAIRWPEPGAAAGHRL